VTGRGGMNHPWEADEVAPSDATQMRSAAAELERFARATDIAPRAGLSAQIMASLAAEPTPAPLTALSDATRRRRLAGMLAALRDTWRVAFTGGRPVAIRLSAAMAVVVLLATVGSVGGLAAVGAWSALNPPATSPAPSPSVDQVPVIVPPMQPNPSVTTPRSTVGPEPTMSPTPMQSQGPTPSATPMHTARPTTKPMPKPTAMPAPMPTHHPEPTSMPMPTHHPEPTHGAGHT
jgi:hypothetical protein